MLSSTAASIATDVEQATSEKKVEEDWGLIISICDRAAKSSEEAKSVLRCIYKRLNNPDPHIGVKAVTLLDACVKNSGKTFHIEVASREFVNEFEKLLSKGNSAVKKKLKESLKKWAETEFKSDSQLNLIPSLYTQLKSQGHDFSTSEPQKRQTQVSKDPNVVESQEEEEQILKAIELSLKDTSGSPRSTNTSTSLYPSFKMSGSATNTVSSAPVKEPRKVRALYDFEAAEDNELTFNSGEIICVIDDSDANWWKGSNQRGEGLFPANFVTADLSVEPENYVSDKSKKSVQFKEKSEPKEPETVEINELKIDRLLHLLHEADPTNPEHDTEEMLKLEGEANAMGPLIDIELERVDRKHAQLTQLSADLVEALNLYHTLMQPANKVPYGYAPPNQMAPPPNQMGPPPFAGFPPHMHPPQQVQQQQPQFAMHGAMHAPMGPYGGMPGMPPQGHMPQGPPPQSIPDDRRFQSMPNYGHPNMAPTPNFQQTPQPGGPPPGIPFIPSSTHIMQ